MRKTSKPAPPPADDTERCRNRIISEFVKAGPSSEFSAAALAKMTKMDPARITSLVIDMIADQMLTRCSVTRYNNRSTAKTVEDRFRLACVTPRVPMRPLKAALQGRPIVRRDEIRRPPLTANPSPYDVPVLSIEALAPKGVQLRPDPIAPAAKPRKSRVAPPAKPADSPADRKLRKLRGSVIWRARADGGIDLEKNGAEIVLSPNQVSGLARFLADLTRERR